jgi:hypothetical protein
MPTPDAFQKKLEHAAAQPTSDSEEGDLSSIEDTSRASEQWTSPEEGAEQLYALWRDYNRKKITLYRDMIHEAGGPESTGALDPTERQVMMDQAEQDPALTSLKDAIRTRWHNTDIQAQFKHTLERSLRAEASDTDSSEQYTQAATAYDAKTAQLDTVYKTVFSHREKDPDELLSLELTNLVTELAHAKDRMETAAQENPELAAELSFLRIARYRKELTGKGFMWTPSREAVFSDILQKAVLLNRNRPITLVGETGTGKTELARALSRRLTGREPARTTARDQNDPGRSLGFRSLEGVDFGVLGQALTGKTSSKDTESGPGKIAFLDEANKYPEDFIRMLVKTLAGKHSGESVTFEEWYGQEEPLAQNALLVLGMNLPDTERGRHLDRPEFSSEVKRELAPTTITVDYMPQTPENPELFEVLLAASMDKNERIRIPVSDIAPAYKSVVHEGVQTQVVDNTSPVIRQQGQALFTDAPAPGGALWRFANLIRETQKLYTGEENILTPLRRDDARLDHAVLEPGLAISWIEEYKKSALRDHVPLAAFLSLKLTDWAGEETTGGQHLFRAEDRARLHELFLAYGFDEAGTKTLAPQPLLNLTPKEIGALSPRVPRALKTLEHAPPPLEHQATKENGDAIIYLKLPHNEYAPGMRFKRKNASETTPPYIFLGLEKTTNLVVLEDKDSTAITIDPEAFATDFERQETEIIVSNALNPFREYFIAGDIPETHPAAAETYEAVVNIEELLTTTIDTYRAQNLPHWADALLAIHDDIRMNPEKRRVIEQELRDGAIPILMPGKDTLQATTPEELTQDTLHPLWIKDGVSQTLNTTYLWDHIKGLMEAHHPSLTEDVPDRPYLSFMKPTATVDPRTTNKTVEGQKQELLLINQERRAGGKHPAHATNPYEHAELQYTATHAAQESAPTPLTTLTPLDDVNHSYTRFITLPFSADGYVPGACFGPVNRRVGFSGGSAVARLRVGGFRLSVRVEL